MVLSVADDTRVVLSVADDDDKIRRTKERVRLAKMTYRRWKGFVCGLCAKTMMTYRRGCGCADAGAGAGACVGDDDGCAVVVMVNIRAKQPTMIDSLTHKMTQKPSARANQNTVLMM